MLLRSIISKHLFQILYIKIHDFYKIIKQYPNEWSHLDRCISEFAPIFDDMFHNYVKKHTDVRIVSILITALCNRMIIQFPEFF